MITTTARKKMRANREKELRRERNRMETALIKYGVKKPGKLSMPDLYEKYHEMQENMKRIQELASERSTPDKTERNRSKRRRKSLGAK